MKEMAFYVSSSDLLAVYADAVSAPPMDKRIQTINFHNNEEYYEHFREVARFYRALERYLKREQCLIK